MVKKKRTVRKNGERTEVSLSCFPENVFNGSPYKETYSVAGD